MTGCTVRAVVRVDPRNVRRCLIEKIISFLWRKSDLMIVAAFPRLLLSLALVACNRSRHTHIIPNKELPNSSCHDAYWLLNTRQYNQYIDRMLMSVVHIAVLLTVP